MQHDRTDRAGQQRNRWLRWAVLSVVLVGMTAIAFAHQAFSRAERPVPIDALCPFGAIESAFTFISGAGFIEKTAASSLILLIGTVAMALVYRRSFCGQLCPLGFLQELFGGLGRKLFGRKRPTIPAVVDGIARYLKYAVLAFFAVWSWQAAALVMRPYDPWVAWAHITSAEVVAEMGVGLAILGISLVGSFVHERFFCKYLCPMGAFLAFFSKISFLGIQRDADACIDCGRCDKACPMNIEVATAEKVTASECISCNECVNACPAAGALEIKSAKRSLTPAIATGVTVALIAGLVTLTTLGGSFDWMMPSLADAVEEAGAAGAPADVSVIKGYMSMREISEVYGIPEKAFIERWGVPEEQLGEPMKEIKDAYGFSPDEVRVWVEEELAK